MTYDRRTQVLLAALALGGVVLRLLSVGSPGFPTDVSTFMAWAERLAQVGPAGFYEPGYFSDYPPGFLYVLWLLGALLDGEALRAAVKAVSIPFDVAIALVLARVAWQAGGPRHAVLAAALWLFAPGIVFAGAYWGQVDAVGTLPFVLALISAGRGRWVAAGALAGLAAMMKPQFGLALILVLAAATFEYIRGQRLRPVAGAGLAASAVILALAAPFRAGVPELVALVRSASETYPYTSLFAFNPWSIVADFWKPDDGLVVPGGIALAAGIAASAAPLWWRRDVAAFLACGACAVFAFYFLPTRAHERYLFPAFALLLPFAVLRARLLVPYVALAVAFAVTLYFVFAQYDLVQPAAIVEATLFTRPGQILLAALMTGLAGHIAWRLARGDAVLRPAAEVSVAGAAAPVAASFRERLHLPAGLGPGYRPTRRDLVIALLVALAVLATRGYRLDHPRDMYFDEVYHARTAYELLAQREVYEWTHPHLAKELMALGILAFGGDRVAGRETISKPDPIVALAVTNEGLRIYALADGRIALLDRGNIDRGEVDIWRERADAVARDPIRGLAVDGDIAYVATARELIKIHLGTRTVAERTALQIAGTVTALAAAGGRVAIGTDQGSQLTGVGPAILLRTPVKALALRPDGTAAYLVDPQGVTHVVNTADGTERTSYPAGGPVRAIAHALSSDRLFLARSDIPSLEVIELEGGRREVVPLSNARTGDIATPASALAVVPRTQFLHALAGDRLVAVETHGASPYASVAVTGERLAVDGTADELLVGDATGATRVATGRQALSWRLPGVIAGAVLAFFIVLLSRRLFASALAPVIAGLIVLADGSMFAQPRIGMNDVYVACFLIAGWYFVVAAHAPRRSAPLDLLIAGIFFGLAAASKWVAFYALGGLGLLSLAVTAYAYARERSGSGGPLDLLRGRGTNALYLFACFALVPVAIYLLSYVPWFGGPTIPYGWDLRELTQQMYWYHSGLTSPHPAGSPWWSWPLVLKPVYWYYGASEAGSAVIYDAGNVILFWGGLAAVVWCAVAAVRARSLTLGLIVFALAVQLVAWVPISRVLFFYHFFTALPWYFLALTAALIALWERGRREIVAGYLALAVAAFAFFYPFVSGLPVPADQTGVFFILPTWQYDCQFYPAFRCELPAGATQAGTSAIVQRLAPAVALLGLLVAGWALLRYEGIRSLVSRARR
ncbi:MAG TPA: phospholipid carrier-dependent glycosyltransferase [Candidatus Limnocylindria bacterium]|nr:phospholipid carrier-dependent glycosyltransferase [Candidatus Limnocylindria bacterium]